MKKKMDATQENTEKSISERIDAILAKLSKDQVRFVVALQEFPSKKDAAEAIGLKPDTVYRWNGEIEEAARLMAQERLEAAHALRRRALAKAIMVKLAGLDSQDEGVRQKAATEIIEWEMGKAAQRSEVTGAGGDHIIVKLMGHDNG